MKKLLAALAVMLPSIGLGVRRLHDTGRTGWLALLALIPLVFNWSWASRRTDYSARDWAYNLLMSVEPYGILFTNGDNDTFPLWYLQETEGIRRDVTVVVTNYDRIGCGFDNRATARACALRSQRILLGRPVKPVE